MNQGRRERLARRLSARGGGGFRWGSCGHACEHSFELAEHAVDRIDVGRMFVCETITPLYYCPVYRELPAAARRRYNQLVGLFTNEIVTFFESSFANSVLTTLARETFRPLGREMGDELLRFAAEERKHVELWRGLNRAAAPRYGGADYYVLQIPRGVRGAIAFFTTRPVMFPVVLWLMLLQEERSIDISRRCVRGRSGWRRTSWRRISWTWKRKCGTCRSTGI